MWTAWILAGLGILAISFGIGLSVFAVAAKRRIEWSLERRRIARHILNTRLRPGPAGTVLGKDHQKVA